VLRSSDGPPGFRDYVAARQTALIRGAYLLTGDWQAAEDLVQAALVRVWPHWARITRDRADPDAYVRRVLVNQFISGRRRRWRDEYPAEDLPDVPQAVDLFANADLKANLHILLVKLPPRQRAVLVLRFYYDLTEAATADTLGCTVGTVKSQTAKAMARLRAASAADGMERSHDG
jgi:RNA polymerase sigma-70 factor (sigma-E family)